MIIESENWTDAKADCEARGAKLATLLSDAEVEEVAKLMIDGATYWIGGHCEGNSYKVTTGINEMMVFM